jgi:hypothetical protein
MNCPCCGDVMSDGKCGRCQQEGMWNGEYMESPDASKEQAAHIAKKEKQKRHQKKNS